MEFGGETIDEDICGRNSMYWPNQPKCDHARAVERYSWSRRSASGRTFEAVVNLYRSCRFVPMPGERATQLRSKPQELKRVDRFTDTITLCMANLCIASSGLDGWAEWFRESVLNS